METGLCYEDPSLHIVYVLATHINSHLLEYLLKKDLQVVLIAFNCLIDCQETFEAQD
jgi:hypothetical protein